MLRAKKSVTISYEEDDENSRRKGVGTVSENLLKRLTKRSPTRQFKKSMFKIEEIDKLELSANDDDSILKENGNNEAEESDRSSEIINTMKTKPVINQEEINKNFNFFINIPLDNRIDTIVSIYKNPSIQVLTEQDLVLMTSIVYQMKYFSRIREVLGLEGLMKLTEYISIMTLPHDVRIVTYGQHQKSFYFILRGGLNVYVPTKKKHSLNPYELIDRLEVGEGFGDIAILTNRTK